MPGKALEFPASQATFAMSVYVALSGTAWLSPCSCCCAEEMMAGMSPQLGVGGLVWA